MIATLGALGSGFAALYWLKILQKTPPCALSATVAKTASTGCLALAGALAGVNPFLVAGLAFGALGDFALTRPGPRGFLAGLVAFAIGHLLYIPAFLTGFGASEIPDLPVILALAALILSSFWWLLPHTGRLRLPVLAYVAIIAAMALAAFALPPTPGQTLIRAGVVFFVGSDLILALRRFRLQNERARNLAALTLWPLYFAGQALILAGAVAAL